MRRSCVSAGFARKEVSLLKNKSLKKFICFAAVLVLMLGSLVFLASCGSADSDEIYIYNYGEYLADGTRGTFDSLAGFQEYYEELTGREVKIYYTTYPSNEDMYAKISSGTSAYDVIFPSDYMVERMIREGLLGKIRLEEVCEEYGTECYYDYIQDDFRGLYYDPTDEYSVPYTYGRVGIITNRNKVDEEDKTATGWDMLWNEKYAGQILQFNNSRDGFATAQYLLGYDVNSTDPAEWEACLEKLMEQKPLVQSYVLDEIYNKMESGEAAIGAYYAGDYFTMLEVNEDLEFFYPEKTNIFVDCMCVPANSENPEIAALFINYMLTRDPAVYSAEFIYYSSPNSIVYTDEEYIDYMGEDVMEVLYPEDFDFKGELDENAFRDLDPETLQMISDLWEELKISGGMPTHIYVEAAVLAVLIIAAIVFFVIRRRRRSRYW